MKKINFLFGALAALAMGGAVTACSDDDLDKGIDNGVAEVDQTRYLNVTISNPKQGGSRATTDADFSTASKDENFIKTLYFVFYDANGDVVCNYPLEFVNNTNTNNVGPGQTEGEFNPEGNDQSAGSVGKIWTSTVPVNLSKGQNLPSYVMAFVNPITPNEILTSSLSDVEKILRNAVTVSLSNATYYPMSNSVYYGTNPITGESNVRMVATPITTAQLAKDPDEAKDNPTVEIYVERYASKINLTLEANKISANETDVNDYTLTFVPTYWRPNAIDETTYIVKHYALQVDGTINSQPTYSDLNDRLNPNGNGWEWNEAEKYRSYWACSPSYYENSYPKVSDNIQDVYNVINPVSSDNEYPYSLHYFTYNEIANSTINTVATSPSIKYENGFSAPFYSRETTASSESWKNSDDYNPAAVVASAVIVGKYTVTPKNGKPAVGADGTFYLYTKTGNKWNLYNETDIVGAMASKQQVVLENTGTADDPVYERVTTANDYFVVEHPSKEVRAVKNTVTAGRFVALQIDKTKLPAGGIYYYDSEATGENKYTLITEENVDDVNSDLLSVGYARKYGKGLAYFSIPIQHLGFNQTGELDYSTARAGSFGLVRNHVYTININSISGLATALRDENQPIVPPMDEQTYYISAKLNVLNWRIVPTQNVIL